jgi:D-lactate dehydrogenase (cytochrome)
MKNFNTLSHMIIKTAADEIQGFLEDASTLRDGFTDGVYFPESYAEVATFLKQCTGSKTRVTISGNGTGTTGGRIPYGGHILATNKFNKILSIEKFSNGTDFNIGRAVVQPAVLLGDLQKAVEEQGMFYPPDPTERNCFIGATVSNNSSGARTFKYGQTRPYVERLKLAFTTGDILDIRRGQCVADEHGTFHINLPSGVLTFERPRYEIPNTKHAAGYFSKAGMDLIDLFIGSEGTLAVVVEIELRLIRKPEKIFSVNAFFASAEGVLAFVDEARRLSKQNNSSAIHSGNISARAIEYFDEHALNFLRQKYDNIPAAAKGCIFLEQEVTAATEESLTEKWFDLLAKHHALMDDSWFAQDVKMQDYLREFRHSLPVLVNEWLARTRQRKVSTDMSVPDENFKPFLDFYLKRLHEENFHYIIFGHIGNSHLHLNILPETKDELERAWVVYREFIKKTIELKGSISAEHGVGKVKSKFLAEMFGEAGIREMARIKHVFDPSAILNVGNLIPENFLTK